ncbi:MAG: membrane protein insertase YidC [Lentisphaeria bacterium]|nr:membrane protein insertase YidC [Lentisphaeria bacterium]
MKFDKDIVMAVVICAVVLFGWDPLCRYMGWTPAPRPQIAVRTSSEAPAPQAAPAPAAKAPEQSAVPAARKPEKALPPVKATLELPPVRIANPDMVYRISPASGSIDAITLLKYRNAARTAPVELDRIADSSQGALSLHGATPWQVENILSSKISEGRIYTLSRMMRDGRGHRFAVTQTWELAPSGYAARYRAVFSNPEKTPVTLAGTVLCGADLPPWHIVSGDKVRIPSHRMDYLTESGDYADIKADKKDQGFFVKPAPRVKWVSLGNKYFTAILASSVPFTLHQSRVFLNGGKSSYPVISAGAVLGDVVLAPGESKSFDFAYYSGPKIIADLDRFDASTGRVMHLAWGPLDYLARLLLWILVKFHGLLGSYGWSIVLLTIVVRAVFYPLTARGNASMRKMQTVQPQLKEIREKYKSNPQLMNAKMMELYRREGVSPFSGCLPILLQIPVFFALYATLDGAVELRQVPFLWCRDLAAADTVATIPLYFFSLPVNPLVLAMTALMVVQQHMTPMSMDPVQKKMMALMPIVMLFMLYDLPSGLTLYWTVSNFFSIIQLKLQQRSREKENRGVSRKTGGKA